MNRHTLSLTSNDQDWIKIWTAGRMSRYLFSISIFDIYSTSFLISGWVEEADDDNDNEHVACWSVHNLGRKKPRRVRVLPLVLRRSAQCSISLISQDSGEHRQLSAPSCPLCLCCVIFRYLGIWLGSYLLSPPPPVWSRWGAAPAPSPDITRWSHSSGSGGHHTNTPHGHSRYPVIFLSFSIIN